MIGIEVKGRDSKNYMGTCKHLENSNGRHIIVIKIGRPDRIYGKYYEA
jgi:hypothetical protein